MVWGGTAQKISQGGSDWYLRFRSERDLDRPETVKLEVKSRIDQRYSVTNIIREIFNPANVSQVFKFEVVIPSSSFISNLKIGDSQQTLESSSTELQISSGSSSSKKEETENTSPDQLLFNTNHIRNQFSNFVLPITLGPGENTTITVTYEDVLKKKDGFYIHEMFLKPGEIVKHFNVDIEIVDHFEIQDLSVHASVLGDISNETISEVERGSTHALVNFTMNTREQAHHFASKGFYGTVSVQFGLNKTSTDIFIQDDYFVHSYEIPTEEKHVVLVIENDSQNILGAVSEKVIELEQNLKGESSLTLVYLDGNKTYIWPSSYYQNLQNFILQLCDNSSYNPLSVSLEEWKIGILQHKETLDKTIFLHLTNSSVKNNILEQYFDNEILTNITVNQISDLREINRVEFEYQGNVDKDSLTKTEFFINPNIEEVKVAGKLHSSGKDKISVNVSTFFNWRQILPKIIHSSPGEVNLAKGLHAYLFLQDSLDHSIGEVRAKRAKNISLENNFITPFTNVVIQHQSDISKTYSYHQLLSPLLSQNLNHDHSSPCLQPQDLCDHHHQSCPPLSVTSSQEGEVLISGSEPHLNLSSITLAPQVAGCCWILYTEPGYVGDREQFCGGEDTLSLARVGSVRTV